MSIKKFTLGLIVQVGIKFLAVGFGFYTTRWLITNLSETEYLTYNLITSYNASILILLWFGIPQLLQKYFTHEEYIPKRPDIWASLTILRIVSYFIGIIIILITFPLSQTKDVLLIIGIFTAQFLIVADIAYRAVCDALGIAWKFSSTDFVSKCLIVLLLFVYSYSKLQYSELFIFIIVSLFAYSFGMVLDYIWHKKHTPWGTPSFRIINENKFEIIFLTVSSVAFSLYYSTVPLFLNHIGYDNQTISGFTNAFKFYEISAIVPGLVVPTIASQTIKRITSGKTLVSQKFNLLSRYTHLGLNKIIGIEWFFVSLIIAVFTSLSLYFLAPFGMKIIDPSNLYPLSLEYTRSFSFTIIPLTIAQYTSAIALLYHKEKSSMIISLIVMFITLTLYILILPLYGAYGAIFIITLSFIIDFCLKLYIVSKPESNPLTADKQRHGT